MKLIGEYLYICIYMYVLIIFFIKSIYKLYYTDYLKWVLVNKLMKL